MLRFGILAMCLLARSARGSVNLTECASTADGVEVSDGVRFVRTSQDESGRGSPESVLSALKRFIGRYDLRVRLAQLFPADGVRAALAYLDGIDAETGRGRAGGKKTGGMLMMATMMGGTMAALGFGALGMLAMKALTVSAMALLLSIITAIKKFMSKQENHDSGHIVSYVPVHHGVFRRRRDV